jgi:hypothetical protein
MERAEDPEGRTEIPFPAESSPNMEAGPTTNYCSQSSHFSHLWGQSTIQICDFNTYSNSHRILFWTQPNIPKSWIALLVTFLPLGHGMEGQSII